MHKDSRWFPVHKKMLPLLQQQDEDGSKRLPIPPPTTFLVRISADNVKVNDIVSMGKGIGPYAEPKFNYISAIQKPRLPSHILNCCYFFSPPFFLTVNH